jgi:type I restriction enzyme S subunit
MGLNKYKIGEFVEPVSIKCGIENYENIIGINIDKQFIPSRNVGKDTSKYSVVPPNCFAFNLMHVGRDEKIPVALNNTNENLVVSPAYFVFQIIKESVILKEYFYMLMSSPEFDRYAWFCTDSSIRGNLDWNRFCEIEINLPPIEIQQKYVDIYNAMQENQKVYENGLDGLKLACDAYIHKLQHELPRKTIGTYLEQVDERNTTNDIGVDAVRGIATSKEFITTKANLEGVKLNNYKTVPPQCFAYVPDTSRRGDKISLAYNNSDETYLVSAISTVFKVKKTKELLPSYLMMYFNRSEFDRYARYNSWGSARETFTWDDLKEVKIPIPDIEIQQSIVNIYNAYITRKEINEKMKILMKNICPILIKGSLEEATKT